MGTFVRDSYIGMFVQYTRYVYDVPDAGSCWSMRRNGISKCARVYLCCRMLFACSNIRSDVSEIGIGECYVEFGT